MTTPSTATDSTRQRIAARSQHLPLGDTQDFDDAARGLVGRSSVRQITADDGRVVWDLDAYAFFDGPPPDTANPSLWRQGQLLVKDGLYEVVPGIYQLRGFDLSVMTLVEGDTGVIVIDPLTCRGDLARCLRALPGAPGKRPVGP